MCCRVYYTAHVLPLPGCRIVEGYHQLRRICTCRQCGGIISYGYLYGRVKGSSVRLEVKGGDNCATIRRRRICADAGDGQLGQGFAILTKRLCTAGNMNSYFAIR